jgi:hypothetical protein
LEQVKLIGDEVYIAVRADDKSIKYNWQYIKNSDCWKTSRDSYQRFYDEEKVEKYFGQVQYIINNNSFKLFKLLKI